MDGDDILIFKCEPTNQVLFLLGGLPIVVPGCCLANISAAGTADPLCPAHGEELHRIVITSFPKGIELAGSAFQRGKKQISEIAETEDEIADWIKTSSAESGNVSIALCEDISKHWSWSMHDKHFMNFNRAFSVPVSAAYSSSFYIKILLFLTMLVMTVGVVSIGLLEVILFVIVKYGVSRNKNKWITTRIRTFFILYIRVTKYGCFDDLD